MLAAFVTLLDVTVVNLAVPSIADNLQATDVQSQWILLAYLVPLASLLLPLGRFGDALGRRRLFLFGVAGFALGGLAAGTSQGINVLLASRVLQGVGAATMMPQILALTQVILPQDQRRRAVGYFGMVSALGAVAGPIIGGAILTIDLFGLGWRAVFLLVIPPCILSALIVVSFLSSDVSSPSKTDRRLEWIACCARCDGRCLRSCARAGHGVANMDFGNASGECPALGLRDTSSALGSIR